MKYLILGSILSCILLSASQAQNLAVESYQLDNGFTVYLNADPTATEVNGAVMVKAGGKNDPADATGIAHYLEHLLFKGTGELGTTDYEKEKKHLDRIVALYDEAAKTTDGEERTRLYKQINEEAVAASAYGLPNEFDKLTRSIGGTGINAFTNNDITFYHNSFPGHELERWLDIYSHRFQNPVFRSFQSELEVVYEEKNRSLDNFQRRLIEQFNKEIYQGHPYGEQLVLGTIDHLKNPSLTKMYEFFENYYVANNMALILSGNFDLEAAKPIIAAKFGSWRTGEVPEFPEYPIHQFGERRVINARLTPISVGMLGWKTVNDTHPDRTVLDVTTALLSNSDQTGLLDVMTQKGKLMFSGLFANGMQEDGSVIAFFVPKVLVQSLPSAERLVMHEVHKIANGEFTDTELETVKSTLYRDFQRGLEEPSDRAVSMGFCFSRGIAWEDYLTYPERIASITRQDVMHAAKKYLGDERLVLYSRTGFPKKRTLNKPAFEPVTTDQNGSSVYARRFNEMAPELPTPDFVDFAEDIEKKMLPGGNTLLWSENPINDIFQLKIRLHVGSQDQPQLTYLSQLLGYAGTPSFESTAFKKELSRLGATFSANVSNYSFWLRVEGLEKNLNATLALIDDLINEPVVTKQQIGTLVKAEQTNRKLERSTPTSMASVMLEYSLRGKDSEYLNRPTMQTLKKLNPAAVQMELTQLFDSYAATVHYVGKRDVDAIAKLLEQELTLATQGESISPRPLTMVERPETTIYLIHDKKAVQSQVYYALVGNAYSRDVIPETAVFNQYFGGGFSGIVLQEIREYRSLAYSAAARYNAPSYDPEGKGILIGYTASQADKTTDAVGVMMDIMENLPEKPERFESTVLGLQQSAMTSRPGFRNLTTSIEQWQQEGFSEAPDALAYAGYEDMTFRDLMDFHADYIKGKPITITIYGDKRQMDLEKLAEWGKLVELKVTDVLVK